VWGGHSCPPLFDFCFERAPQNDLRLYSLLKNSICDSVLKGRGFKPRQAPQNDLRL
jgi:hypothetical protein